MRGYLGPVLLLALWVCCLAQPTRTVLPNGAKLIVSSEPGSPWVIVMAFLRVWEGADREKPGTRWVTAQAAYQRHALLSPAELRELSAAVGGGVKLFVERDHLRYEVYTTGKWLENALFLIAGAAKHGEFTTEELEAAKKEVVAGLSTSRGPAVDTVETLLRQYLVGHPFGMRPTEQQVETVTLEDCREFYGRYFRPSVLTLVVAGDIPNEQAIETAKKVIGSWTPSGGEGTPELPSQVERRDAFELVRAAESASAYLALGTMGPSPNSKEFPAFAVLASILGSGETSVLAKELREKGGAYQVGTGLVPMLVGTLLFALVQFSPFELDTATHRPKSALGETWNAAKAALSRVASEGVSEQDLRRAKRKLTVDYLLADPPRNMPAPFVQGHQRLRDRAFWLGWWEMMGCGFEMDAEFTKKVEGVTAEEVITLAQKLLKEPSSVLSVPLEP